jgi:hypothetical protein
MTVQRDMSLFPSADRTQQVADREKRTDHSVARHLHALATTRRHLHSSVVRVNGRHAMSTRAEVKLHAFLTLTLDGDEQ